MVDYAQKESSLSYKKNIYLTLRGVVLSNNTKSPVKGFGMLRGSVGVDSTLVVKNESTTKMQYEDLFAKVLIREMGHLLGLGHCSANDKCVLVSSIPSLEKIYNAKKKYHRPKL